MKVNQIGSIPENDDLAILVEQFKNGLTGYATGNQDDFENEEYKRVRKILLANSTISDLIPKFLKTCRNLNEFWAFIKAEFSTYAERRKFLSELFNPMIDRFEYEEDKGALEFTVNYEEKEVIGQGGFGQVYKYEHKLLKLPFAVKVFAPAFYKGGDKELERFFQEAKMLFQLDHPSIIRIFDAGMIGKRPFIRMEYFEGLNLNQVLMQHGILNPDRTLTMIENLVDALNHAHEDVGIIHRDLKPSNIMVARPNKFRIIDFGLGIFIENELYSRFTKTGENIINGYFNAPELIKNPKLIDKRSDIYSIGAIWFTMLIGQPPAGTTISQQLRAIDGIEESYVQCIEKCLADIDTRYESCQDLLNDISRLKI